ncbi:uncharacterized protein GIQ15_03190 [Arthroderma uncinatum]|uniref:uncharacterized protein n=1 Tax=Arthroderma uncinatum TaxID=74035 RepID=UPI00144AAA7A|nr:uncharacterized protein GIQ15_03190 [Arthroderma uncinatum]KAF3483866.1 hypothetical protein GIQ15_03190 [Arthroderma uncinatum]
MAASEPWMTQFSRYINSAPGIENTLRLLQFSCIVVGSLSGVSSSPWARAGSQFALGRRYFRYFKFIDYFENAWAAYSLPENTASQKRGFTASTLEFCKWSMLGIYLLLEGATIFDALGVQKTAWGERALLESNKFWLYALVFSFLSTLWQLFQLYRGVNTPTAPQTAENSDSKSSTSLSEKQSTPEKNDTNNDDVTMATRTLMKDLVITSCDILIPGYGIGWMPVSKLTMGIAAVVSTLLVGRDRWIKAQERLKG